MHLPLAFSIHHFISSVGADAGFAAIIGLAILVLLYFAQARETTTLRDEAISASQRVEQLERRVQQLGGPPVAPAPESAASNTQARASAPAAPGAPASGARVGPARAVDNPAATATPGTGSPATAAGASPAPAGAERAPLPDPGAVPPTPSPAAPAGVGAPALADATRLIPAAEAAQPAAEAAQPAAGAAQPAAGAAQPAAGAAGPATGAAQPVTGAAQPAAGAAAPATRAAREAAQPDESEATGQAPPQGEEEVSREPQAPREETVNRPGAPAALATPPPATAAAGAGQTQSAGDSPPAPVAANGGGGPPRPRAPAAGPSRPVPPRLRIPDGARPPGPLSLGAHGSRNRWVPALFGVLLLALVIAVLLVVTSGGGSSQHGTATKSTNSPALRGGFSPASVTVAVLNGTDVSQLAHRVEQKLTRGGYKGGTVATAADQTHKASTVAYLPGYQSNALHVASSLGLPPNAVQPVDQSARAIACPPPSACGASVVVTVGSDLASTR